MIAVAPTKNLDRIEWMAEKCTEMGIDRITPLLCRHSERKVLQDRAPSQDSCCCHEAVAQGAVASAR